MITTDAGAPAHRRRHASRHLAAIAIGGGLIIGGFAVSGAASAAPIHDWVPPVRPRPVPELTATQVAEALPVSMVHERNAMLGTGTALTPAQVAEALPVSMVHERDAMLATTDRPAGIDSATRSYIAQARAAQSAATDGRYVYVSTGGGDQPGTGPSPVWTGDAKDHPGYGPSPVRVDDAKDHAGYGPSAPATRAVWLS
jgi:hypothetical protein